MDFGNDFQTHVKVERDAFYAEDAYDLQRWTHDSSASWYGQQYPSYLDLIPNDTLGRQHFDFQSRVQPVLAPLHTATNAGSQLSSSLPSSSSASDRAQFDGLCGSNGFAESTGGFAKGQSSAYRAINDWQTLPGTINPHNLQLHELYTTSRGFGMATNNAGVPYSSDAHYLAVSQPSNSSLQITGATSEAWPQRTTTVYEQQSSGSSITDLDDDGSLSQASPSEQSGTEDGSEYAEESSHPSAKIRRTKPSVKNEIEVPADGFSPFDDSELNNQQKVLRKRPRNEALTESENDDESTLSSTHSRPIIQSRSGRSQKQVVPRSMGGRYSAPLFGPTTSKTTLYESTGRVVMVKIHVGAFAGFEIRRSEDEEVYIFYRRNNLSLECSVRLSVPSSGSDQKLYLEKSPEGVSKPVDYLYMRLVTRIGDEDGETEEMKIFSSERKKLGAPSIQKIKPRMLETPLVYPKSTGHGSNDPDTLDIWHPMRIQFGRATHCNNSKQKNQEHFVLVVELMARKVGGSDKDDVLVGISMWKPIQVRGRAPSHFRDEPAYWEKLCKSQNKTLESTHPHNKDSDENDEVTGDTSDEAEETEADDEDEAGRDDGVKTKQPSQRRLRPQRQKSRKTVRGKVEARDYGKSSRLTTRKVDIISHEASIAKDYCAAVVRLSSSKIPWSSRPTWTSLKPGLSLPTDQIQKFVSMVKRGMLKDNRDIKADKKVLQVAINFVKTALSRKEQIEPRSGDDDETNSTLTSSSTSNDGDISRKRTRQSS